MFLLMFLRSFLVLFLFLIPINSFAASCPALIKQVDNLLAETKQLSKEQLAEIKQLRNQGEEAHKTGDHKESEQLLKQALELLDS